jgi:hypothetical protein
MSPIFAHEYQLLYPMQTCSKVFLCNQQCGFFLAKFVYTCRFLCARRVLFWRNKAQDFCFFLLILYSKTIFLLIFISLPSSVFSTTLCVASHSIFTCLFIVKSAKYVILCFIYISYIILLYQCTLKPYFSSFRFLRNFSILPQTFTLVMTKYWPECM